MKKYFLLAICFSFCWCLAAQVTLVLDAIPANTPAGAQLHAAGSFNGWDAGDADYTFTQNTTTGKYWLTLPPGTGTIEYKFTRGAWSSVETNAAGNFLPNRTFTYGNGDTLHLTIANWEDLTNGGGPNSTAAANVSILSDNFYIPQLDRYRRIWVYVPPDYATTTQSYPVLYMHDGQNVFDASTSFSGEWEVDETLNDLYAAGDPGIIVVAIDNGGSHRLDEYSPWVNPSYGGGEGEAYVDFLVETLKPHIDSLYRTRPEREYTGIMGSSMGGLISTYAGLAHQDVFSKVGALSPAYWFADETLQQPAQAGKQEAMRFYQLIGTPEGASYVADMWQMQANLLAAGFGTDEVRSVEKGDGQHSEWFWAREFAAAYEWLFAGITSGTGQPVSTATVSLFPNPASDQLQVQLKLPRSGQVNISIVDSTGRFSNTLFFQELAAGDHTFQWSLRQYRLPAGHYYCVITAGGQTQSLDFVLTR